jgi:hypothetical protein
LRMVMSRKLAASQHHCSRIIGTGLWRAVCPHLVGLALTKNLGPGNEEWHDLDYIDVTNGVIRLEFRIGRSGSNNFYVLKALGCLN